MKQQYWLNFRRKPESRIFLLIFLIVANGIFFSNAQAQPIVTIKVTILRVDYNGCRDPLGTPDIYFDVTIDGVKLSSRDEAIESNIHPFSVNKEFSEDVDFSKTTIPIKLEQFDRDDGFIGTATDRCDITSGSGNNIDLTLNLATCQFTRDLNGNCDTPINSFSTGGGTFIFKIEVVEQPRAPNLTLRCLHSPIWPQPGELIHILAEVLDGNGNTITDQPIENIEIWADDINEPIAVTNPGSSLPSTFLVDHVPANGATEILYRCRANDNGEFVSTGWRRVQIGQPPGGRKAVRILNTGLQNNRVDIVFIADKDSYNGASDPQFLNDVSSIIRNAYYARDNMFRQAGLLFLQEQDMINFWIALNTGDADIVKNKCTLKPPKNWSSAYSFADTGVIVHTDFFRDCASPDSRIFSSEPASIGTFLHETGHSPFGLADEYCCDGGYFQTDPFPNLYKNKMDCRNDLLSSENKDSCVQPSKKIGGGGVKRIRLFRLDSASTLNDDLMTGSGNRTPRAADSRRINWFFDTCRDGSNTC